MKIDESGRFLRLAATALTAAMFWLFCVSLIASRASEIKLAARAAVLMELRTGKILWQRNKDLSVAPASTTKILTALVVLERSKLDDIVTVPVEATLATGGTARLKEGERLAVEQLLYGMLLGSANDAAMALAKHAGGSVAKFVGMMNDKARSLGALQSSFRNPTGLGQRGHMTTARDLAVITKAALEKAEFRRIVNTKNHPWKSAQWQGTLKNSNVLLDSYPGAIGVKTGQTREAGFCIVAAAQRGATTLVAVILNSTDKAGWQDAENLLELGFKNFTAMSLIEPGDTVVTSMVDGRKVAIAAAEPAHYVRLATESNPPQIQIALEEMELPIAKGEKLGEAIFHNGKKELARVDLIAKVAVPSRLDMPWVITAASALMIALLLLWFRRHRRRHRHIFTGRGDRLRF